MTDKELNRTPMKCPNGCLDRVGPGQCVVFKEYPMVNGKIGVNNYCQSCGSELVELSEYEGIGTRWYDD